MAPVDKGPNYERGTYFYFDAQVSNKFLNGSFIY